MAEPSTKDDLGQQKVRLRAAMRDELASIAPETRSAASEAVCNALLSSSVLIHGRRMMAFAPLGSEPDILPACGAWRSTGRSLCFPRTRPDGGIDAVVVVRPEEELAKGPHGVLTPIGGQLLPGEQLDLVLVPGLAFDARGGRLGRGGGYYDRFLATLPRTVTTVGVCFQSQVVPEVPRGELDRAVGWIATETGIRRSHGG